MLNQIAKSPIVGIGTYLSLAKRQRGDLNAGFRRWIKTRKVRRRTTAEWDVLWSEYQGRSIK